MELFQINHIAVHVSNLKNSVDFYNKVMKFPIIHRPDMGFAGAWLGVGLHQELHLIAGFEGLVNSHSRGNHFAFETESIAEAQEHFINLNYPFRASKQRADGAWQIFIQDPDGYAIEIYQRKNTK